VNVPKIDFNKILLSGIADDDDNVPAKQAAAPIVPPRAPPRFPALRSKIQPVKAIFGV
jgi:hypothetical protein